MAANQDVAAKYHHVIDTAMSMTQATEVTENDNTTVHTQWSAFTANHETLLANMQRPLEQCMQERTGTPPPLVIDTTSSKNASRKRRKSPPGDGPEGVTKTTKYYKKCDNAC